MWRRHLAAVLLAIGLAACATGTEPEVAGPELQLSVAGPQGVSAAETSALAAAFDQVDQYRVTIADFVTFEPVVETTIDIAPNLDAHVLDIDVPEEVLGSTVTITLVALDGGLELYRSTTTTQLSETIGTIPVELEIRYSGPGIRGTVTDEQGIGVGGVDVDLFVGQSLIDAVTTEPDGTYLFVGVPVDSYSVVVGLPSGFMYVCPGARDVAIGQATDAIVADFGLSNDFCGVEVLVLSGGDDDDTAEVATLLSNNQSLTITTFFYLNELPGVDFLSQFDVVLLFMNGLFDESRALGSEVYDYVQAGGNVVTASFYWQGRSDSGLGSTGWGSLELVDPFTSTGGTNYTAQDSDVPSQPGHPLMSGVSSIVATTYWGGAAERPGTEVVMRWLDGSPLAGYRILPGGQRLVAVSMFPAAGTAIFGDVQPLWDNAVSWAGAAGGPAPVGAPD